MPLKPLEKDNNRDNRGLGLKIGFLIILLITGILLTKLVPKAAGNKEKNVNVLGAEQDNKINKPPVTEEATRFIQNTADNLINNAVDSVTSFASQSAAAVTDTVFTSTVINIVKQIDKLPDKQQSEIKQAICH